MGKLTAIAVKAALANPGTYQDGEGLFLKVDKRGGASWFLRLQRDGKRHDIGLGSAKLLTLAEARETSRGLRKRSEEHTSELQSLMRISYAVFCLKKKNKQKHRQKDKIHRTINISKHNATLPSRA